MLTVVRPRVNAAANWSTLKNARELSLGMYWPSVRRGPMGMLKADDYSVKLIDVAVDSEWTKYHATKKVGDYLGGYITAPVAQGE
ncbi:MAG: hypothetical protein ACRC0J_01345, partial [Shewanella oncorhynchi]